MKNAEKHAFKVNDTKLQHKVIEALQGWNIEDGEYQLAIEYGKKILKSQQEIPIG